MKLIALYSQSHEALTRDYFTPSVPRDLHLELSPVQAAGSGDYGTPEFNAAMVQKVSLILKTLRADPGGVALYADVDVIFLGPVAEDLTQLLRETSSDILFQREGRGTTDVNMGFVVCRSNERALAFLEQIIARQFSHGGDDQQAANALLAAQTDLRWGYLPWRYSASSHGFPPPEDAVVFHANATAGNDGVRRKIHILEDLKWIRKYGWLAQFWWRVKNKIRRLLHASRR
jgi:hypothetical protein